MWKICSRGGDAVVFFFLINKVLPVASQSPTACAADSPGTSWHNWTTGESTMSHHTQLWHKPTLCLTPWTAVLPEVASVSTERLNNSYPESPSDSRGTHGRRQFLNCSGSSMWDSSPVMNSCTIWWIKDQWVMIVSSDALMPYRDVVCTYPGVPGTLLELLLYPFLKNNLVNRWKRKTDKERG